MPEYDNAAVAAALDDFGDLLEIAGVERYRTLSYHRAANGVRAWDEDIMATALAGGLTEVPGVGPKIAAAISELMRCGTFPELQELAARIPPSVLELIRVPGLGAKKAKLLYDSLGIASIDDLEEAISDGRLRDLPGFGDKTVEKVSAGIERYRRMSRRMLLVDALPLAERIAASVGAIPGVGAAAYAGSVRRMKETVGDIDILAASDEPVAVMEEVCALPIVTDVLVSGPTVTSVMTTSGRQADIYVVPLESWGSALQYFTGSSEHTVRLREIARARGMRLTEFGLFRESDDAPVASASEEDLYAALGMPVVPPEVREDAGEIELALSGRLPDLVRIEDIRGDLHVHTTATDGRSSVEQNRERAATLGYEYIACSDHAYDLRIVGGLDVAQLEEQWALIDELNARGDGPVLLKSIELNIGDDGTVDYPPEVLARFDYCIASLHHGFSQPRDLATRRVLEAMDNPYVDIIGHLTGRLLGRRDPFDLDVEAVIAKAADTGTMLELNSHPERLDLNDVHLRMAREAGVRIAIDTDAHDASQLGHLRWGIATARRGWIAASDVANAQPLDVFRSWLKRNRP